MHTTHTITYNTCTYMKYIQYIQSIQHKHIHTDVQMHSNAYTYIHKHTNTYNTYNTYNTFKQPYNT